MEDFTKPTEQMYSLLFQKPKMSQKLLSKPPFKYIYDIIKETTNITGYARGLYQGDELDSNYFDNKEKKVIYLQKIKDLTQLILVEEILANPYKIVAGSEPELTNLMLQAIYRAAISGKNSDAFVQQILDENVKALDKQELKQQAPILTEPIKEKKPELKQDLMAETYQVQNSQMMKMMMVMMIMMVVMMIMMVRMMMIQRSCDTTLTLYD